MFISYIAMASTSNFWYRFLLILSVAHAVSLDNLREDVFSKEVSSNGDLKHTPLMRRERRHSEDNKEDVSLATQFFGDLMDTFTAPSIEVSYVEPQQATLTDVSSQSLLDLELLDQADQASPVLYNETNFHGVTTTGSASKTDEDVRSGNPGDITEAAWANISLPVGMAIVIRYQYVVGFACNVNLRDGPPTFEVLIGGSKIGSTQGPFNDYPFDNCEGGCPTCYSPVKRITSVATTHLSGALTTKFVNGKRNINLKILEIRVVDPSQEEGHIVRRLRDRHQELRSQIEVMTNASRGMAQSSGRAQRAVRQLQDTARSFQVDLQRRNVENAEFTAVQNKSEQETQVLQEKLQKELQRTVLQMKNLSDALSQSKVDVQNQSLLNETVNSTVSALNQSSIKLNESITEATGDLKVVQIVANEVLKAENKLVVVANNLTVATRSNRSNANVTVAFDAKPSSGSWAGTSSKSSSSNSSSSSGSGLSAGAIAGIVITCVLLFVVAVGARFLPSLIIFGRGRRFF
jgi:DNA-binding transcriptional regulator GbsR (MarR family)